MKMIKEILFEARSRWSKQLVEEYRLISKWVVMNYFEKISDNEMLDLESIKILGRSTTNYRIEFKIRTMMDKTILGTFYEYVEVPLNELDMFKKK